MSLWLAACGSIDSGPTAVDARAAPTAGPQLVQDVDPPPTRVADGAVPAFDSDRPGVGVDAAARPGAEAMRLRWLVAGRAENPEFALHTYVLLGSTPTLRTDERYRRVLAGLLAPGERPAPSRGAAAREPGARNVTYLPVLREPAGPVDADWVLANYDWENAAKLLLRLRGSYPTGPYIVSTTHPLSNPERPLGERLEQDLSDCPMRLIDPWMAVLHAQATQVEFWRTDRLQELQSGLHEGLARALEQTAGSDVALDDVIDWIEILR